MDLTHYNFRPLAIYSQTLGVSDTIYLEAFGNSILLNPGKLVC
jgi:hypothetical protein